MQTEWASLFTLRAPGESQAGLGVRRGSPHKTTTLALFTWQHNLHGSENGCKLNSFANMHTHVFKKL